MTTGSTEVRGRQVELQEKTGGRSATRPTGGVQVEGLKAVIEPNLGWAARYRKPKLRMSLLTSAPT